jgi:hypothetical protein
MSVSFGWGILLPAHQRGARQRRSRLKAVSLRAVLGGQHRALGDLIAANKLPEV